MAYLFRPIAVKPIPRNATVGRDGKKTVARWTARGGKPVVAEVTANGKKCRVRSPTWWVQYTDSRGRRQNAKGFRSREATLQLAAQLERQAEAVRAGVETNNPLIDAGHMAGHLPTYEAYLAAKCGCDTHVKESVRYVRQVLTEAGLTTPATVDVSRVQGWLDIERLRVGPGKRKWSQRTYNHRVTKLKAFGNWLVKRKHAKYNPFIGLETANAEADRKHVRRALEHVELLRLIAATRASVKVLNGMDGSDRAALYLTAAYTGFRARGLASLALHSIQYRDGIPAAFMLTARASKNGRPHTVPLHPDVGRQLAVWLASRTPREKLWPGDGWSKHGAKMLRSDLAEARAAYLAEAKEDAAELDRRQKSDVLLYRDAAGEVFDFHSLRVQFVTGLARSGVPLMAAAKLAAHSDPRLTAVTYAKWGRELDGEVAKLPGLGSLGAG